MDSVGIMKHFRRSRDLGINGRVARWYNNNTRKHRIGEMQGYAAEVDRHVTDGASVLEVAPGPGYLSIELAKLGNYHITGMDISRDFVDIARRNAEEEGVDVEFLQGNAAQIPFPDDTFDFVVCTAAFKNFREPLKALNEMYRVLKPGGTVMIGDMNRNATGRDINTLADEMGVRGLEALFMKGTFRFFLRKGAYTRQEFIDFISQTGCSDYEINEKGIGFAIYLRK